MKRKTIFSFVLIALLLIGIGYASISDHLQVGATVKTDYAELDLIFTNVEYSVLVDKKNVHEDVTHDDMIGTSGTECIGSQKGTDTENQKYVNIADDRVDVEVKNMAHKGDKVQYVLTIKNVSAVDDMLAVFEKTDLTDDIKMSDETAFYFDVTANLTALEVGYEGTVQLIITIELLHSVSEEGIAGSFSLDLAGTYNMAKYSA